MVHVVARAVSRSEIVNQVKRIFSLIAITGTYKYVRVLNASKGIALFYVKYLIIFIVTITPGL